MIFLLRVIMQNNSFAYVRISDFREAYKSNRKYCNHVEELLEVINENEKTPNLSLYEVLENSIRRIYFDIERIPTNEDKLIYDIIRDLSAFMEINADNYGLTLNKGSHHEGLSYHLTFPYKTHAENILNLVRKFKLKYPKYNDYIDECVYNVNRLFRLPNQYGLVEINEIVGHLDDCFTHSPIPKNKNEEALKRNLLDVHRIQHGTMEDMIIQNYDKLPMYNKIFERTSTKRLPKHAISYPIMNKTIIELMTAINNNNQEIIRENVSLTKQNLEETHKIHNTNLIREIIYVVLTFILVMTYLLK